MAVKVELEQAIAELVREIGPRGVIYEQLKDAQTLVDGLGPDALKCLDEAVAILESHRELYEAGEERPLPPRLLELFGPLTPDERGSILRIFTIVFALRAVRPQTRRRRASKARRPVSYRSSDGSQAASSGQAAFSRQLSSYAGSPFPLGSPADHLCLGNISEERERRNSVGMG